MKQTPAAVTKMAECDCELLLEKRHANQEVTQAVLKIEPTTVGISDQNHNIEDGLEPKDVIPCGVCSKKFSRHAGALISHGENHGGPYGGVKRKCTQCDWFSGSRTSLLKHTRSHHTLETLFRCSFCDEQFATCTYKKSHEKRKHVIRFRPNNVYNN